jgi:steroid delta-isomerase-like uncharacterized protein
MTDTRDVGMRFYELVNERRWDDLLDLIADDYVGHGLGSEGREGVRQDIQGFASAFADLRFTVEDTVTEGDKVVVKSTMRGTHSDQFAGVPASGQPIEVGECDVFRVVDGKIAEAWTLCDSATLFMQIGAIPVPAGH